MCTDLHNFFLLLPLATQNWVTKWNPTKEMCKNRTSRVEGLENLWIENEGQVHFAFICQVSSIHVNPLARPSQSWGPVTCHYFFCLSCKANAPPFILALFLLSNVRISVKRCRWQKFHREPFQSSITNDSNALTKSHRGLRFCVSPHGSMAECLGWTWVEDSYTKDMVWNGDIHHAHEKNGHVPARIDRQDRYDYGFGSRVQFNVSACFRSPNWQKKLYPTPTARHARLNRFAQFWGERAVGCWEMPLSYSLVRTCWCFSCSIRWGRIHNYPLLRKGNNS